MFFSCAGLLVRSVFREACFLMSNSFYFKGNLTCFNSLLCFFRVFCVFFSSFWCFFSFLCFFFVFCVIFFFETNHRQSSVCRWRALGWIKRPLRNSEQPFYLGFSSFSVTWVKSWQYGFFSRLVLLWVKNFVGVFYVFWFKGFFWFCLLGSFFCLSLLKDLLDGWCFIFVVFF